MPELNSSEIKIQENAVIMSCESVINKKSPPKFGGLFVVPLGLISTSFHFAQYKLLAK